MPGLLDFSLMPPPPPTSAKSQKKSKSPTATRRKRARDSELSPNTKKKLGIKNGGSRRRRSSRHVR